MHGSQKDKPATCVYVWPRLHDNALRRKRRDFSPFQLTVYTKTMKTPGKTDTFENGDTLQTLQAETDFKTGDKP